MMQKIKLLKYKKKRKEDKKKRKEDRKKQIDLIPKVKACNGSVLKMV